MEAFATFFRNSFIDATFHTKMYNLEKPVVPFLRRRPSFLSESFGEQEEKSIHKDFVKLASTFSLVNGLPQ